MLQNCSTRINKYQTQSVWFTMYKQYREDHCNNSIIPLTNSGRYSYTVAQFLHNCYTDILQPEIYKSASEQ